MTLSLLHFVVNWQVFTINSWLCPWVGLGCEKFAHVHFWTGQSESKTSVTLRGGQ